MNSHDKPTIANGCQSLRAIDNPIVSLRDVGLERDNRVILSDINLDVNVGDFMAITGPNGGGKTTLLRIILGLRKPTSGVVTVAEGLKIGYLPQKNMIDSHFPISIRQVVESGLLGVRDLSSDKRARRVDEVLDKIGMQDRGDSPIGVLSGGQLQRTLLARAIISSPQLLVLDEPLSYIDKRFESQLYKLLEELSRETTIMLVSHEMTGIEAMATRHIVVDITCNEV